jgi:MinD-like ATPase involved in chromosome partitioning or flagellar assembly
MKFTRPDRRVITFYSFKGGVGRTMAVANIAYRLADTHALDVIAVDWDLEAPGLHKFFGLTNEQMTEARGVLDYLLAWRDAVRTNAPAPPEVTPWLIPIEDEKHAPRHGSLSLLSAGRLDADFGKRLAELDWKAFYADTAGAAAIETLREQLVTRADAVLIDSRTGLTDAGGICTIQLPDAVLLMTAPNDQSLEGIEQVARGIMSSSAEERAGRERPRRWLSVARVPSVEETYLASQWFKEHEPWFQERVEQGLWHKEDQPGGLKTYELPHRGRWAFGEWLLNEASGVDPSDPLVMAYQRITGRILRWLAGPLPVSSSSSQSLDELRERVRKAEERGDVLGLVNGLLKLGSTLGRTGEYDEARRTLERASDLAVGGGLQVESFATRVVFAFTLLTQRRYHDALSYVTSLMDEVPDRIPLESQAGATVAAATACLGLEMFEDSLQWLTRGMNLLKGIDSSDRDTRAMRTDILDLMGRLLELMYRKNEGERKSRQLLSMMEQSIRSAIQEGRHQDDRQAEAEGIRWLLRLAERGVPLPDASALQARLEELTRLEPGER